MFFFCMFFFFKQKTAYEMRISDWSSDVCSSDLGTHCIDPCGETDWVRAMIDRYDDEATGSGAIIVPTAGFEALPFDLAALHAAHLLHERTGLPVAIGRASCRERVCQYV